MVAVTERPDLTGRSDEVIFETAVAEGRAVVTNDIKNFRPPAARCLAGGNVHAGLVLLPSARARTKAAVQSLAAAIETVLNAHPDGLGGTERRIGPPAQD